MPDYPLIFTAANGMNVPFEGWIEVVLKLASSKHGSIALYVLVLVSQEGVSSLLLGFSVIQEIIMMNRDQKDYKI